MSINVFIVEITTTTFLFLLYIGFKRIYLNLFKVEENSIPLLLISFFSATFLFLVLSSAFYYFAPVFIKTVSGKYEKVITPIVKFNVLKKDYNVSYIDYDNNKIDSILVPKKNVYFDKKIKKNGFLLFNKCEKKPLKMLTIDNKTNSISFFKYNGKCSKTDNYGYKLILKKGKQK